MPRAWAWTVQCGDEHVKPTGDMEAKTGSADGSKSSTKPTGVPDLGPPYAHLPNSVVYLNQELVLGGGSGISSTTKPAIRTYLGNSSGIKFVGRNR